MQMPGRKVDVDGYRYGFNGKENDNEIKGEGNSVDFGARMYDSRLGRWFAIDPLASKYPTMSPYNFVANSPLVFIDPDGRIIDPAPGLHGRDLTIYNEAIQRVKSENIELYNYLNNIRYHGESKEVIEDVNDPRYAEAIPIVIHVKIGNLDQTSFAINDYNYESTLSGNKYGQTMNMSTKSHQDGQATPVSKNSSFRSVNTKKHQTFKYDDDGNPVMIDLTDLSNLPNKESDGLEIYREYFDLTGTDKAHFEITLDDFLGLNAKGKDNYAKYGKVLGHELGHIEGWLIDLINWYYFTWVDQTFEGSHHQGEVSGQQANKYYDPNAKQPKKKKKKKK